MTAQGPISRAFAESLKDAQVLPRDSGAVALARRYAQLLDAARNTDDEARVAGDLGPKLLAALSALGMTLAGRAAKPAGGGKPDVGAPASKLDELKARRSRRLNHA